MKREAEGRKGAPSSTGSSRTVLITDDDDALRGLIRAQVGAEGFVVEETARIEELRDRLRGPPPSLVLLDLMLPDGSGLDALPEVRARWPETPVVMITGHATVETSVEAMHRGAFTYLQKPFRRGEVMAVVRRALETGRLLRQAEQRRRRKTAQFGLDAITAESAAARRMVDQARVVADSPASTVLLLGESGTGKGMLARAIHYASRRAAEPFLTVTCSAIPESLLEAELLGHERGAFTDAKSRREGVFEAADGGTVFLDEVGDMPLPLQAKLLGVLEERSFRRIGGNRTVDVDVRVIAATHRDLDRLVAEGRFRHDLLYRLRVVDLLLPPLRERADDIVPLTETFIRRFNGEFGRNIEGTEAPASEQLRRQPWPGNIRELRNVVERAMLFARGRRLTLHDLALDRGSRPGRAVPRPVASSTPSAGIYTLPPDGVHLADLERELVRQAMERAGGVKSHAAKILGLSRDQMRYRLRDLDL